MLPKNDMQCVESVRTLHSRYLLRGSQGKWLLVCACEYNIPHCTGTIRRNLIFITKLVFQSKWTFIVFIFTASAFFHTYTQLHRIIHKHLLNGAKCGILINSTDSLCLMKLRCVSKCQLEPFSLASFSIPFSILECINNISI